MIVVVIGCHRRPVAAQADAGTATETPTATAIASVSATDEPSAICEHGWQLDNAERTARGKPLDHSQSERKLAACRERFEHVRGEPEFPCMSRCMMNASDLRVFNACEHECGVPHGWGLH